MHKLCRARAFWTKSKLKIKDEKTGEGDNEAGTEKLYPDEEEVKPASRQELKKLPLRSEVTARAKLFAPTEPTGVYISKVSSNVVITPRAKPDNSSNNSLIY